MAKREQLRHCASTIVFQKRKKRQICTSEKMTTNKTLIFKKIPTGFPVPGEHLAVEDRPIDLNAEPPKGGLLVENLYASFDPYLRGKMREAGTKSYSPAFDINGPFINGTVSRVLKSSNPDYKEGDLIVAYLPIAEYAIVPDPSATMTRKIHNPHNLDLGMFLGPLGMPGLTGFAGLYKIGQPKKGETIFISSAAGAVGQVVGQIAHHEGLKVIGSVGSDEKLEYITKDLGFDGGFNYKKESAFDALPRLAPDGIDIYFENVGGEQLDAALTNMNSRGRIPVCGMISIYNQKPEERYGSKALFNLLTKTILMQGFLVGQPEYGQAYYKEHQESLQKWIADGSFKAKLDVTEGIDNAAKGFVGMLKGENFGKAVLKIK
ncbi:NAD(P)-binding protein [Whalleya microplaca]|nr:NAD(P)-binding protein [Whalleya microplaca]